MAKSNKESKLCKRIIAGWRYASRFGAIERYKLRRALLDSVINGIALVPYFVKPWNKSRMTDARKVEIITAISKQVHGDHYQYASDCLPERVERDAKVDVRCCQHGIFTVSILNHLLDTDALDRDDVPADHGLIGEGSVIRSACPECAKINEYDQYGTSISFISFGETAYDDRFDYRLVKYINGETPVTIICTNQDHGPFQCSPDDHLDSSYGGCPKCIAANPQ